MNILITGIHGFVGSNLVVALKERHGLYGLDIVTPEKDGVIKTFSWDDLDKEMPEFDAVIHLAGKAHEKHTEGGDFREAVYRALRQGLRAGKCRLLEPYYGFRMEIPAENLGRAMADIEKVFTESEPTANLYVLRGKIKLAQYEKERAALDFKKAESMGYNKEVIKELLKLTMNN